MAKTWGQAWGQTLKMGSNIYKKTSAYADLLQYIVYKLAELLCISDDTVSAG